MSLVYKCDRCGEIIPDSESIARRFIHRNFVRGNIVFDIVIKGDLFVGYKREITLCKKCDDSFIHWFQSGKKE